MIVKKTVFSLGESFLWEILCPGKIWKLKDLLEAPFVFHTGYIFTAIKLQGEFQEAWTYVS